MILEHFRCLSVYHSHVESGAGCEIICHSCSKQKKKKHGTLGRGYTVFSLLHKKHEFQKCIFQPVISKDIKSLKYLMVHINYKFRLDLQNVY
jgi:hypothetical protein